MSNIKYIKYVILLSGLERHPLYEVKTRNFIFQFIWPGLVNVLKVNEHKWCNS